MRDISLLPNAAAKYLGTKGRPNKFSIWYSKRHKVPFEKEPWCAMFVSYVANSINLGKAVGEYAYCPSWVAWFKKVDRWGSTPRVGAIVFFDWNNDGKADHVGIVESVKGKTIYTIEGNTGGGAGMVKRQPRGLGSVLGYGYPVYPAVPLPQKLGFHTVLLGDTLIAIAKHYYSDPLKWKAIYQANRKVIGPNPAMIRPGMKLVLP